MANEPKEQSAGKAFEELAGKLVRVPKKELVREIRKARKRRAKRKSK